MANLTLSSLAPLLREKRGNRGIREIAGEIGISSATLSRVENGKTPDLDTFSKICKWLQLDPSEILDCKVQSQPDQSLKRNIPSVHLRADKNLSPKTAQALVEMILVAQKKISKKLR